MNYIKKLKSLEEIALIQVAINKCQSDDFKETVLCLEKPTYGDCIGTPKTIDDWHWHWNHLVEDQCQRLTEDLPLTLKCSLQCSIRRIALEYLSFSSRQESLFGISGYFMMQFLTRKDWSQLGRLDEERLAKRLVKNERLTIFQRYRIACVYCLQVDSSDCVIATLWGQLTQEQRHYLSGNDDPKLCSEKNPLVLLWSYYWSGRRDEKVTGRKGCAWRYAIARAVRDGNKAALMPCWRSLKKSLQKYMAKKMAFDAFYSWLSTQLDREYVNLHVYRDWRCTLFSGKNDEFLKERKLRLPFHYSDLFFFFLSEMSETDQLNFFKEAFQDRKANYVLECFLDWPHQDFFLPTVRRLWGILPKYNYGQCLLILTKKYANGYLWTILEKEEDDYCDYKSLLFKLWEETPKDYKRYIFTNKTRVNQKYLCYHGSKNSSYPDRFLELDCFEEYWTGIFSESYELLLWLLQRHPFREDDEIFFKSVFNEATTNEKKALILTSEGAVDMWSTLSWEGNWPLLDWFFKESLVEEAPKFKKEFIESAYGREFCVDMLRNNRKNLLEELIDWSFESNEEKTEFKKQLVQSEYGTRLCCEMLRENRKTLLEELMDWTSESKEEKTEFKKQLIESKYGKRLCFEILGENRMRLLEEVMDWAFESKEQKTEFKQKIILGDQYDSIKRMMRFEEFSEVERVASFCIDPQEMKKFKARLAMDSCCSLLRADFDYIDREKLTKILEWCFDSEEEILKCKKEMLLVGEIGDLHYYLIGGKEWKNLKIFHEWFNLSLKEIEKLKEDAFSKFSTEIIRGFQLERDTPDYLPQLQWCLTGEQMIADFKAKFEDFLLGNGSCEANFRAKEYFNYLIKELLSGLKHNNPGDCEALEEHVATPERCEPEEQDRGPVLGRGGKRNLQEVENSSRKRMPN